MCAFHNKSDESSFEEDFLDDDLTQSVSPESLTVSNAKVESNVFVILSTDDIVKDLLETVNEVQGITQVRIILLLNSIWKFKEYL